MTEIGCPSVFDDSANRSSAVEKTGYVCALAQETGEPPLWLLTRQGLELGPFRSIANDEQLSGWTEVGQRCSKEETHVLALDQPTHDPDHQRVIRQSQLSTHLGTNLCPRLVMAEIDAILDDRHFSLFYQSVRAGAVGYLHRYGDIAIHHATGLASQPQLLRRGDDQPVSCGNHSAASQLSG